MQCKGCLHYWSIQPKPQQASWIPWLSPTQLVFSTLMDPYQWAKSFQQPSDMRVGSRRRGSVTRQLLLLNKKLHQVASLQKNRGMWYAKVQKFLTHPAIAPTVSRIHDCHQSKEWASSTLMNPHQWANGFQKLSDMRVGLRTGRSDNR